VYEEVQAMFRQEGQIKLTANAKTVLEKRYLRKDDDGKVIEKPEDMLRRVANNIAQADRYYDRHADVRKTEDEFYGLMSELEFLPNSPTLMNAGRDLQQLSACFVLPIEDSMEGIFETLKSTALIHKSGGGTGYSFSRLRSQGSQVKSTSGIASGPISFLKVFDAATQAVKQGGTRRGANMGILRVDHPDILEFITCKEDDKSITNFNISVAVTDDFMRRVISGEDYDVVDPHNGKPIKKLNAREVFDLIIKQSHKNGEPGVIFIDRMNKDNATPKIGEIESTNPCGEQPLLPYESCNLGSINLARMLTEKSEKYEIDWPKMAKAIRTAVHFLDNVIDMNKYPVKKIEQMTRANRKIGLGVMGFADMLIALGISYNSDEAVTLAEKIMKFILDEATKASVDLAKKRNAFANYKESIYSGGPEIRNATLTTIAPTGTLSIIASCSSGVEPIFSICYYRKVLDGAKLMEVNPYFEKVAKERGFYSEELMKKISQQASIQNITEIPEDIRKVFVTAHDITPIWHIKMQAAFQKYTNNAVSKTVNFPYQATPEEVKEVYTLAYKLGCKGVTIYRDGSRQEQVLNIDRKERTTESQLDIKQGTKNAMDKEEKNEELDKVIEQLQPAKEKIAPRPRPKVVCGTTTKIQTGCGNLYVTINEDENGRPFEVFTQMGKAGGCAASQLEAVGRLVSLALRSGIDIKTIIDQLEGIRCPSPSWEKGGRIFSCADALAKVIERILLKKNKPETPTKIKTIASDNNTNINVQDAESLGKDTNGRGEEFGDVQYFGKTTVKNKVNDVVGVCPDCGGALHYQEGCMICHSCAFTKCG
jgi:ribonucleoside-diphosphate reductase alpha chain